MLSLKEHLSKHRVAIETRDLVNFSGDAIIVPCDTDLTYRKGNPIVRYLSRLLNKNTDYKKVANFVWGKAKQYEDSLLKELSAIGYCDIGNAVITKAYFFKVNNFIFMPLYDHDDTDNRLNTPLLHKALRSAFDLASLYGLKNLAMPMPSSKSSEEDFTNKFLKSLFFENFNKKEFNQDEFLNIVYAVFSDYKNSSLENITIYK